MEKEPNIIACGVGARWLIVAPRLFVGSLLGFLFWSAVIAAAKQVWLAI